jgi:hypothetical protein
LQRSSRIDIKISNLENSYTSDFKPRFQPRFRSFRPYHDGGKPPAPRIPETEMEVLFQFLVTSPIIVV